jgi:hypothetical protein
MLAAQRVIFHPKLDLALVEITGEALTGLAIGATAARRGMKARMYGLGETDDGATGQLRVAFGTIVAVEDEWVEVDADGRAGACSGDSGGPLLPTEGGGANVLGILSLGSRGCDGFDLFTRLDRVSNWFADVGVRVTTQPLDGALAKCESD